MIGYQEILAAAKREEPFKRVFLYVDAMPYRIRNGETMKRFTKNIMFVDPTDDPAKLSFYALRNTQVHICGGDTERVRAFAERVWAFKPSVLCWDDGVQMEVMR